MKKTPAEVLNESKKSVSKILESSNAHKIKGIGKFKPEKYIGEVAFDDDGQLTDDEVLHMSFYEGKYGKTKIIVGYVQVWGETKDGSWSFLSELDKSGDLGGGNLVGDWYGDQDTLKTIRKQLGIENLIWTESGMQGRYMTLTHKDKAGGTWF